MKRFALFVILSFIMFSCQSGLSPKEVETYRQKGGEIMKSTGEKLSSTLMSKIKEGGIDGAVGFCNVEALPITRQMSDLHGAEIKRTSLRIRNPKNAPTEEEVAVLNYFQDRMNNGKLLEPRVELDKKGRPHYYAPILIEKKCLMCHGQMNRELSVSVDSIIRSRYPEDLATGYKEGELRGMWSIAFDPDRD